MTNHYDLKRKSFIVVPYVTVSTSTFCRLNIFKSGVFSILLSNHLHHPQLVLWPQHNIQTNELWWVSALIVSCFYPSLSDNQGTYYTSVWSFVYPSKCLMSMRPSHLCKRIQGKSIYQAQIQLYIYVLRPVSLCTIVTIPQHQQPLSITRLN